MLSYAEYKEIVEQNLLSYIPPVSSFADEIKEAMIYSLSAGGKRLRPVLLLASCDFGGGNIKDAIPYAVAIEYIHTYSLVHDDLPAMDDDTLRRGKPTNHVVYGEDMAILAGDGLLNSAYEIIANDLNQNMDNLTLLPRYIKASSEITQAAGVKGMIAGQVADIKTQGSDAINDQDGVVDFIEDNKTGALITAPVVSGLYIAGAKDDVVSDFRSYAESLGRSFQIADDILDFTSTPEELGKSVGKDMSQDKCNYVMVYGIDAARTKLDELTDSAISSIEKYGENARFFIDIAEELRKRKA